ncbi:MAG: phosphoribosyltransferase family protein [Verrucomicrobiota bacterium]
MAALSSPRFRTLISKQKIAAKNRELAQSISRYYQNKDWVILGLMSGSLYFLGDLLQGLPSETIVETWKISSYQGTKSTGKITGIPQKASLLKNRHVLIIDDILDTGCTLSHVQKAALQKGAKSVQICVLLSKKVKRTHPIKARWIGFQIPPKFVVGYGLDLDGRYRGLSEIVEVVD